MQNVMQALYLTRNARGLPASARRYTKDDGLFLAGLLALEGFVDGGADGVAALGGGQDALSLVWLDFITSLS